MDQEGGRRAKRPGWRLSAGIMMLKKWPVKGEDLIHYRFWLVLRYMYPNMKVLDRMEIEDELVRHFTSIRKGIKRRFGKAYE